MSTLKTLKAKVNALVIEFDQATQRGDRFGQDAAVAQLMAIGDPLTKELVCSCDSLDALIDKWPAHGYRPTLREPKARILADIYDLRAKVRGIKITAYRG